MNWHNALDSQMELWDWARGEEGQRWLRASYLMNSDEMPEDTQQLLRRLYSTEVSKLWQADTYYVAADMCALVDAAAQTFEPEPIYEHDFLGHTGFLLYEKPFPVPDRFDEPTTVSGFSWQSLIALPKVSEEEAARLNEIGAIAANDPLARKADFVGVGLTLYTEGRKVGDVWVPSTVPMHFTPWYYGMEFAGNEVDLHDKPTGARWWWVIVQTTLRLMQQSISQKRNERPPRSTRRRIERVSRQPSDHSVTVIHLRRPRSRPQEEGEGVEWQHQWVVQGHWRKQWYPSIQGHKQIWISSYIKGPEDKPLLQHDRRVFSWDR